MKHAIICLVASLGLAVAVPESRAAVPAPTSSIAPTLAPTVAAAASARGLVLERLDAPESRAPQAGDTVTVLFTLSDGDRVKQWISAFTLSELTAQERDHSRPQSMTVNLGGGRAVRFSSTASLAVDIHTWGPIAAGDMTKAKEKRGRAIVNPEFLGLGFDRAVEAFRAYKGKPEDSALPPELERAGAGVVPALMAFFRTIQATPGLREILWQVVEKPSAWSVIKSGGALTFAMDLNDGGPPAPEAATFAGLPTSLMTLNLRINDRLALESVLYVTPPKPPLLTTAGVVRIVAHRAKHPGTMLDVRILSARLAPVNDGK